MGSVGTLTPLLKKKVDELFLHWFSEIDTQNKLRQDLAIICGEAVLLPDRPSSPTGLNTINININSRPSSPPIPPSSPTYTPRSPRRRTSSSLSRKSFRKSLRQSVHEDSHNRIYPGCAKDLKSFYFPFGEPSANHDFESDCRNVKFVFDKLKNNMATVEDFASILQTLHLPTYWKLPFFTKCGGTKTEPVSFQAFTKTWKRFATLYHDDASRLFHMMVKENKSYLEFDDFEALLQDIINTHPGLKFLVEAPEFHSRYILTEKGTSQDVDVENQVISRIFYTINRSWNGRITLYELRRSNFLQEKGTSQDVDVKNQVLCRLEEEEDINQIVDYFSYEHFYVIYCKFWELDTDHDMMINKKDLARYSNGALSNCMLDRLFRGCITKGSSVKDSTMAYADFVWFILSEVDKSTPTRKKELHKTLTSKISIEYWFRCMDLNGDGVISLYEMEHFYEDQVKKMMELGMETLAFNDCVCQMLDLVKPSTPNVVTLHDLKNCKLAPVYFDTFFNLDKWLEHEQKDPFQMPKDENEQESSIWDRYVNEEYELLVAEEGGMDGDYEDDFDIEDDLLNDDVISKTTTQLDELGPRWSLISAVSAGNSDDDDITF